MSSSGLGLGLALSRGLTEAMDGSLTPESTPGGGLTMTVALPVADPAHGPVPDGDRADVVLIDQVDEWSRPHQGSR